MRSSAILLTLLVLAGNPGCNEAPDTSVASPTTSAPETPAPTGQRPPTEVEMVAAMEAHYRPAILAHDALLQGNLPVFRAQMTKVSVTPLPPSSPSAWTPLHAQMQSAAATGIEVMGLDDAADAMASLVISCGVCHMALGDGPIYPAPAPDDADTEVRAAMREHQWASERLWEGITGPWDNAWERGSAELAEGRTFESIRSTAPWSADLQTREAALRDLGAQAMGTTVLDERAALYGQILVTCAGCHAAAGVEFPTPD